MLLREALQCTHLLRLHRLHLRIRRHTPSLGLLHRSLAGCRSVRLRMKNDGLMWLLWHMEMPLRLLRLLRLLMNRLLTLLLCLRMQVRRPRTLRLRLRLRRGPAVRLYSLYILHRRCRLWWLRMSSLWLRVYERRWVCRRRECVGTLIRAGVRIDSRRSGCGRWLWRGRGRRYGSRPADLLLDVFRQLRRHLCPPTSTPTSTSASTSTAMASSLARAITNSRPALPLPPPQLPLPRVHIRPIHPQRPLRDRLRTLGPFV